METFSRGTSLDPWFVTGLAEGLGSFTYSRSGRQLALYFGLKMAVQDEELLEEVRGFFGEAGRLYRVARLSPRSDESGASAVYYRINRRDELPFVVEHFDRFPLRSAKAMAYGIWREMVEIKQEFRKPDRDRLNELVEQLSALGARRRSSS